MGEWTFDNQTLVNSGTSGMTHDGTFMNSNGDALYTNDTRNGSGYSLKIDSISESMTTAGGEFLHINNSDSDASGYRRTFASHAFTLSMWIKTDGSWRKWDEFGGKGSGDAGDGWGIRARLFGTDDADGLRFDSYNDGNGVLDGSPYVVDLEDQQWHLITGTYDGAAMNLYIDAHLVASSEDTIIVGSEPYPLVFGARNDGSRGENILIDDIRFFNTALTAQEVVALAADEEEIFTSRLSPVISAMESNLNVQFPVTYGEHYQVECIDDLSSSNGWQTVTDIVWAATSPLEVSTPMTNNFGFYRVIWMED